MIFTQILIYTIYNTISSEKSYTP